jgi:NNP family nitrate/nitrite transporter-like MFS transporter
LSTSLTDKMLSGMAIVTSSQQTDTHSAPAANGPRHTGRSIPVALLAFLGVLFFLNIVSRLCVGPLLPVIEQEFGLRHSGAGSLYFFLAAGSCVGLYLSGHVAWRLSHRATIAVSGMTLGAALVAIAFTPSLLGIRAELLLLGIGAGLYLPSGVAVLTENTHEGAWGKVLAIHEIGPNLGYICAPLIAELLLGVFSWQGVLGSMGVPAILLSGAFLFSGLGGTAPAQRPGGAAVARVARDRAFWGVASLFAVSIGLGLGIYSMMPLFLVNDVGMGRVHANLITGLSRISGLFSVLVAGALADRIGRPRAAVLSLTAAGACAVLLGVVQGPWITPVLAFLQAASAASFYPAGFSLLSSVFPLPVRNLAVSMVLILATLFGAGGVPPLIGLLADTVSFSFAFSVAGAATLAFIVLFRCFPSSSATLRADNRDTPSAAS